MTAQMCQVYFWEVTGGKEKKKYVLRVCASSRRLWDVFLELLLGSR